MVIKRVRVKIGIRHHVISDTIFKARYTLAEKPSFFYLIYLIDANTCVGYFTLSQNQI